MKKLLILFNIITVTSFITMNETSCFCMNKNKTSNSALNKINAAININVKGINIDSDASNATTTKLILDNIGLTSKEQKIVKISGTLIIDDSSDLIFTINENNQVTKNVSWFTNASDLSSLSIISAITINNIIWVNTYGEGLWKSIDDGYSFALDDSFFPSDSKIISFSKTSQNYIYASSDNKNYISKDNGLNWQKLSFNDGGDAGIIYNLYQIDKSKILFGTSMGVYEGTVDDNNLILISSIPKIIINSISGNDKYIYVASAQGLYFSTDIGKTFSQIDNTIFRQDITLVVLVLPNIIYTGGKDGLYTSVDNGKNFKYIDNLNDESDKTLESIYYNSKTNRVYFGYGHAYVYFTTNGIDFTDINWDKTINPASFSEIKNSIWISGDSNNDSFDTNGIYYYNWNF